MDYVAIFRDIAFPIAVTAYLLIVTTKRLERIETRVWKNLMASALILQAVGKEDEAMALIKGDTEPNKKEE